MEDLASRIAPHILENAWVTDAGSIKGNLVSKLHSILGSGYIGAHPMAGSEKSGFSNAKPNLFHNAVCFLTPTPSSSPSALEQVANFWQFLGCKTTICSPEEHDLIVAHISHLPHLTAAALVLTASAKFQPYSGPGYRDTTRVALGPPELWRDILLQNSTSILQSLDTLLQNLHLFRQALQNQSADELFRLLSHAAETRRLLLKHSSPQSLNENP